MSPNPFGGSIRIQYSLHVSGVVSLRVASTAGSHVRTILIQNQPAGAHAVTWDGKDDAAAAVGPRSYWAVLTRGDATDVTLLLKEP